MKHLLTLLIKKIAVTKAEIPTTRASMLTPIQIPFEQQQLSFDLFLFIITKNIKRQIGAGYKMLNHAWATFCHWGPKCAFGT